MFPYDNYGSPRYAPYQQYPQAVPDQLQQLRAPYQGQQYPPQQVPAQNPQQAQNAGGILWCQGEEGAKAWPVAPGTTVQLMDSESDTFYLKSVDASGMPRPLRIFDFTERVNTPKTPSVGATDPMATYATQADLAKLWAAVEALTPKKEDDNG